MRSLPLLLAVLIGLTGLALGLAVLLRQAPLADGGSAPLAIAGHTAGPTAGPTAGHTADDTVRSTARPEGHIYAGIVAEPDDVNPFTCHGATARRFVLGLTHEGLLDIDPVTGQLRGAVAEAFEPAPDGMSCTFTLREGVRFSDGSPVTMADVLFGWELACGQQLQLGFLGDAFGRVAAAEALDERRLRVTFRERHYAAVRAVGESWLVAKRAFFEGRVATLCQRLGCPVPAVASSEFGALLRQIQRECGPGTGPFQLPSDADGPTTWRRRTDLLLIRNEHCWRRSAMPGTWNLDGMRLLFREGPAMFSAMLNREVDWHGIRSNDPILEERPDLAKDYRKLIYDYEALGVIGILWNCQKPALADAKVRRALGMLIDQPAILARFPGALVAAKAFAKPDSPCYPQAAAPLPFHVGEARRLLREAGFDPENGTPLRLSILATPDGGPMDLALDLMADAAKQAGVVLEQSSLAFPAYVAQKKLAQWDGLMVNRSFRPWGDPFDFVHSMGTDNDGKWQNAEADRLATAARGELDATARDALLRQLHEIVYREQPFAFLAHPRSCILWNRHIQDAEPGPRGLWPERWWVPLEFQRK